MIRRPPGTTRTDTLFPYTTLCRSGVILIAEGALSRKAEKLTAERQSEQERQQLQSELIHISRVSAMGTMASTLAHELNQPLTAIINCLAGCERALDQKQIDRRELRGALERRSEEHTSELQSLMRISYAVFCLKKKRRKS